jgi:hypothetical protein
MTQIRTKSEAALPLVETLEAGDEIRVLRTVDGRKQSLRAPSSVVAGAVTSVNGEVGAVVLDAADVSADPAGTASGLMTTHTAAHPIPTTRDARNEAADAAIQAHVTGMGSPHTAAGVGAPALNATGALGNLGATPTFAAVDGTTYSATYSAAVTSWAGVTLALGAGCVIGPIPNTEPWAVALTGLTAIETGALDDIAEPGVVLVLANLGGTIYGRATVPA